MFKCVFIPADGSAIQEQSKSKSGGLEQDKLRMDAEAYFKTSNRRADSNSPEQMEQVNEMLRKQGIDPATVDKGLYSQIPNLGGACEIVSLFLPTPADNFTAISMYCDSNGQTKKLPVNARATDLARCCGHNTTIYGDAFIGRCHDDESKPWVRLDFTTADMSSDASWVKEAKRRNTGKNMNAYSTSGTMENFMKQHASKNSTTTSPAVEVLPDKPEDIIKKEANNLFVAKKYEEAEALYTKAIEIAGKESLAVLFTNRSATRLLMNKPELALEDAEKAIAADATWMKAYHRKSAALEKLGRHRDAYFTWNDAILHCKRDVVLMKQYRLAANNWIKVFRHPENAIVSDTDLVERFQLLTDKRERLSTLAHIWNDSSTEDRFQYFQLFLSLISGGGGISPAVAALTSEHMLALPMHNYPDLTRDLIACWCDYFNTQNNGVKLDIFKRIWATLSSEEQNDVIVDFRLLMSRATESIGATIARSTAEGMAAVEASATGAAGEEGEEEGEEELKLKPTAFSKNG